MPLGEEELRERALRLEWILTDVDGVLTDGRLVYGHDGEELKLFHVRDGLAVKLAQRAGLKVGILSARSSIALKHRTDELGLDVALMGEEAKGPAFSRFLEDHRASTEAVAYLGDDLQDLPVLRRCGLSFAPSDAVVEVRSVVDRVLEKRGGDGAFREAVELLLRARGTWEEVIRRYTGDE